MVQKETLHPSPAVTDLYVYRDISLLEFQRRVLELARDKKTPLLERVKFLAILGSNMDEFFMLRMSGIHRRRALQDGSSSDSMEGGRNELAAVRSIARDLYSIALTTLHQEILPKLKKEGIHLLEYPRLTKHQKQRVYKYFKNTIFPLLIPLPLGYGHSFPHVSNLYLNLAVVLQDRKDKDKVRLMRLQVPESLPRLFPVKRSSGRSKSGNSSSNDSFIWLEQIIIANLEDVFPDAKILGVHPFRIIRDAAIRVDDLETYDPLDSMDESIQQLSLQRREFGAVMQVAIYEDMPEEIRRLLSAVLQVDPQEFYVKGNPLGLRSLWELYNNLNRDDLKYRPYKPAVPKTLKRISRSRDFFEAIRLGDILLHHPYDSFTPVVDFLSLAARDPKVISIEQTLYRIGKDSPIVKALTDASMRGKKVTAVIELKATFDEESNLVWAHMLEQSGVNVVHGWPELKTHCKLAVVTRQEKEGIRRYMHLSSGNYNSLTARMYEDFGLFTCDPILGEDAENLISYLTGEVKSPVYKKMLVAPLNLRKRLGELIGREIVHCQAGRAARMIIKVNSLTDQGMIDLLYQASQAGVQIDLIVRGICRLRPGVRGISENIRVTSIVGRYLEHSRIFYFFNGGQEQVYMGSADLMERNLNRRVELLFPLEDPEQIRYMLEEVLYVYLRDSKLAYDMQPDGSYIHQMPAGGERPFNAQSWFMHIRKRS
jgi:polyphosphate kinase